MHFLNRKPFLREFGNAYIYAYGVLVLHFTLDWCLGHRGIAVLSWDSGIPAQDQVLAIHAGFLLMHPVMTPGLQRTHSHLNTIVPSKSQSIYKRWDQHLYRCIISMTAKMLVVSLFYLCFEHGEWNLLKSIQTLHCRTCVAIRPCKPRGDGTTTSEFHL